MKSAIVLGCLLVAVAAAPVSAMDRYGRSGGGDRSAPADPDKRFEGIASAAALGSGRRAAPRRHVTNILKDDQYLRAAFAGLNNR